MAIDKLVGVDSSLGAGSAQLVDIQGSGVGTGFALYVQGTSIGPVSTAVYYFGNLPRPPLTTVGISRIYIRRPGTIKAAEIYSIASGTAGTGESWSLYVRLNGTTDTLIQATATAGAQRIWTNTAMAISVVSGDYIEIKCICPTWATAPTAVFFGGYIYLE